MPHESVLQKFLERNVITIYFLILLLIINIRGATKKRAIVVKGEITITKGFDTWKAMVKKNHKRMEGMGMVMLFAGVEKDDPTKLHAIMKFPDLEALQAFGAN